MRHLASLFDTLGLENDKANRKRVDLAIRRTLGMGPENHCPEVWAAIKELSEQQRADLPARVAELIG